MNKKSSLIWFAIISFIILSGCSAKRSSKSFDWKMVEITGFDIITTVDSLKQIIFRDTIKFNENDLIFTQTGRQNVNSYSMLYIINESYFYMLDIISSNKVVEFVNEILDFDKIESIVLMPKEKASMFGGVRAQNGVVLITLKRNAKFNPFVAGFEKIERNFGSNFTRRRENELMIRE